MNVYYLKIEPKYSSPFANCQMNRIIEAEINFYNSTPINTTENEMERVNTAFLPPSAPLE